ncbi:hypothetical protein M770_30460 (plasmid) [Pseudomonas aeruginosa VRFPA03]|nr:hypothetical protein M770_30460 [Pseudomonas aeruginosa VRFPA03]
MPARLQLWGWRSSAVQEQVTFVPRQTPDAQD